LAMTASSSRMPRGTSSTADGPRHTAAGLIARMATGLVLGCFGFWELTDPAQWTGFVPAPVAAAGPPVSLVLAHGWVLFVLAAAALIDLAGGIVSWITVAVMAEIVLGLLMTSGLTDTLVRDVGLLALALVWALETRSPAAREASGARRGRAAAR
jgi:hypothetical protein